MGSNPVDFFSKIASVTTPLPGSVLCLKFMCRSNDIYLNSKRFCEPRLNNRTQDLKCLNPTGRDRFCLCSKLVTNTLHLRERCFSSCHERRTKKFVCFVLSLWRDENCLHLIHNWAQNLSPLLFYFTSLCTKTNFIFWVSETALYKIIEQVRGSAVFSYFDSRSTSV